LPFAVVLEKTRDTSKNISTLHLGNLNASTSNIEKLSDKNTLIPSRLRSTW